MLTFTHSFMRIVSILIFKFYFGQDTVTERISFNGGENVYAALGSESTESGFSRCSLEEPGISPCSLKDNSA